MVELRTFATIAQEYLAKQKPNLKEAAYNRAADIIRLHLEPFFTGRPLDDIKHRDIQNYVTMRESKVTASTARKELNLCKAVLRLAVAYDYIPYSPGSEVRGSGRSTPEQPYVKNPEEFNRLFAECPDWLRPIVVFGAATGIRLGNILSLEWRNVDLGKKTLTIARTKGDYLHFPLNKLAMQVIREHGSGNPTGRVFPYKGTHNRASVEFKRAVRRAGLNPKLHFDSLRHSFCAHSLMSGNDAITVLKLLGHRTASMTSRYAHLSPEFLQGAAERTDSFFLQLNVSGT